MLLIRVTSFQKFGFKRSYFSSRLSFHWLSLYRFCRACPIQNTDSIMLTCVPNIVNIERINAHFFLIVSITHLPN